MVMMLQYCECCQKEKWFTLHQVVTSSTTAKFVWRCNLCNWVIDYQEPKTELDKYLNDSLRRKGVTQ